MEQVSKLFEEDEEIQVLEPPVKEAPPFIDLEEDVDAYASSSPSSETQMTAPSSSFAGYSAMVERNLSDTEDDPPAPTLTSRRPEQNTVPNSLLGREGAPQVPPLVTSAPRAASSEPQFFGYTPTTPPQQYATHSSGESNRPATALVELIKESEALERQLFDIEQKVRHFF